MDAVSSLNVSRGVGEAGGVGGGEGFHTSQTYSRTGLS